MLLNTSLINQVYISLKGEDLEALIEDAMKLDKVWQELLSEPLHRFHIDLNSIDGIGMSGTREQTKDLLYWSLHQSPLVPSSLLVFAFSSDYWEGKFCSTLLGQ